MKTGLIYSRVSTEEQAKEGQSIAAQIQLCKKYAQDNGILIAEIFVDEGKSGSNTNRPGLQAMLERVSRDESVECVLVLDTDRLARNTYDHLSIKSLLGKKKVSLISISQPMIDDSPEGKFIDVVLAGANALQSQITGRKTSKTMEQKAKAGWLPGTAPIGYRNTDNLNPTNSFDRRIIIPDPVSGNLITKLFQLYSSGTYSIEKITKKLKNLGLNNKGRTLHESTVNNALKNPIYYGKFLWKGELLQGKHTPLTTEEIWIQCQKIINSHNQNASRSRKHNYLLRGFLYCEYCHSRFWSAPHRGRNKVVEYYYCKNCKKGTYVEIHKLEKQIPFWFGRVQLTEKYVLELKEESKRLLTEARNANQDELQVLVNQKTAMQTKIQQTEDRLIDGTLTSDTYKRITSRYEKDLLGTENEITKLQKGQSKKVESILELAKMARNIKQTYKEADPDLKRHYLALFFDKFYVEKGKIKSVTPSEEIKPLLKNGQILVRVKTNWLPR